MIHMHTLGWVGNVYVSNRFSFKISLTFLVCDITELTAVEYLRIIPDKLTYTFLPEQIFTRDI